MAESKKDQYGRDLESLKSLKAPSTRQKKSVASKDTELFSVERLHPNHILPAYRPPSKPHSEAEVQCKFVSERPPRIKKKKKES